MNGNVVSINNAELLKQCEYFILNPVSFYGAYHSSNEIHENVLFVIFLSNLNDLWTSQLSDTTNQMFNV